LAILSESPIARNLSEVTVAGFISEIRENDELFNKKGSP